MFDKDTVELISAAPELGGLDLTDLPKRFTDAFASIVSARMRLRDLGHSGSLPDGLGATIAEMRRLAFTHEALVSVSPERENRSSAAFVAGTAHHVVLLAEKIVPGERLASSLDVQSISPEVSATLLFLIAEANADAAEMAKSILVETEEAVEAALLRSITYLARGELQSILNLDPPNPDRFLETEPHFQAVRVLYYLLFQGVQAMAVKLLGLNVLPGTVGIEPNEIFSRVKELSIDSFGDLHPEDDDNAYSLYPGPLHLASLLSSVEKDLSKSALISLTPPTGMDAEPWQGLMREIAQLRPYLWRNHWEAIASGYLEPGTSAAVSFPTGAGKSTLAELKIATALLRGTKVVFLAPTHALVDQTTRALSATFQHVEVRQEQANEVSLNVGVEPLPTISVMTPERCLTMLSFEPDVFSDIGLLIFDECHLLHPREPDQSQRAIDSMLCVLNFINVAPEADLLFLSAMMANAEEISGWLENLTNRTCLALALTWKPTRQVRGCVVYGETEINSLNSKLRLARGAATLPNAPPASLKRELTVEPFGFFCLHQTWQSNTRSDYALLPISMDKVTLSTNAGGRRWYVTPNANKVSAAIAESTVGQGMKTLIFVQTIPFANSTAAALSASLGASQIELTDDEFRSYSVAVDEAGRADRVFIKVGDGRSLESSCTCHHGLLLPSERHLHESLFKRPGGIDVLVATSTLAQGMNLPAEVVIIGGDSRFDPGVDRMQQLEAHELLNAAGRAGRAGENSYGFVLVVPSKVVAFNDDENTIHSHWTELRAIFAQSDQCLEIDDPMTALLDEIHHQAVAPSQMAGYLIKRLPIGGVDDEDKDLAARKILKNSFAAYRARERGDQDWIDTRIEAAIVARQVDPEASEVLAWEDRLASVAGMPTSVIRELGGLLHGEIDHDASMLVWCNWFTSWLETRSYLIPKLIRREALEGLLGKEYKDLTEDISRGQYALPYIKKLLARWMAGDTLEELERAFGTSEHLLGKCESARKFVIRIIPELAYLFGLPGQVYHALAVAEDREKTEPPLGLSVLGPCVKEGFDRVEKMALRQISSSSHSRRAVHREFEEIVPHLDSTTSGLDFQALIARVEMAVLTVRFLGQN